MKGYRLKKDGTPDLRAFPKAVRILVKELQSKRDQEELEVVRSILCQDTISDVDVAKMATVGTQSIFAGKFISQPIVEDGPSI